MMSYNTLRSCLKAKGYHRYTCTECGLCAWSADRNAKACGNGVCHPYKKQKLLTPMSHQTLRDLFMDFFTNGDHSNVGVHASYGLRRASTITPYASTSYMFAGICAFDRLTRKDTPQELLDRYGGKLYVQNQFCFRFEDLNQVGVSLRHGSGFTMMGLHAFQSKSHRFSQDWEAHWFQQVLGFFERIGFDRRHLYFNEDYWKGNGNGGNCIQFFYQGVELGNMVFIDNVLDPLQPRKNRILDVGLGFERILAATGNPPIYMTDPLRDHLRSLIVGTHDGALCSKIGIGYSMRKLVQRIYGLTRGRFQMLEENGALAQTVADLEEYFKESFSSTTPRLKRIYGLQVQRLQL